MILEMKEKQIKQDETTDTLGIRLCFHKVEMAKKKLRKTLNQFEQNQVNYEDNIIQSDGKLT